MNSDEIKYQNRTQYLTLLTKLDIDLTDLISFLLSINYFEKPLTNQNICAYAGGLCEHALNVQNELSQLCQAYFPGKYSEKEIIQVALFKDIYRALLYEASTKNVKNEQTGNWESVPYFKNADNRAVFGDLGFSSYMVIKKFIPDLSDEVIEAICYSSLCSPNSVDLNHIRKDYPLVTLTTMAEYASIYFDGELA